VTTGGVAWCALWPEVDSVEKTRTIHAVLVAPLFAPSLLLRANTRRETEQGERGSEAGHIKCEEGDTVVRPCLVENARPLSVLSGRLHLWPEVVRAHVERVSAVQRRPKNRVDAALASRSTTPRSPPAHARPKRGCRVMVSRSREEADHHGLRRAAVHSRGMVGRDGSRRRARSESE
jgi:hypothetical protein